MLCRCGRNSTRSPQHRPHPGRQGRAVEAIVASLRFGHLGSPPQRVERRSRSSITSGIREPARPARRAGSNTRRGRGHRPGLATRPRTGTRCGIGVTPFPEGMAVLRVAGDTGTRVIYRRLSERHASRRRGRRHGRDGAGRFGRGRAGHGRGGSCRDWEGRHGPRGSKTARRLRVGAMTVGAMAVRQPPVGRSAGGGGGGVWSARSLPSESGGSGPAAWASASGTGPPYLDRHR
jgi:hypothetical protein